jgi:FtsP/CotA-like multicopper oxidase with cupredoxin domain
MTTTTIFIVCICVLLLAFPLRWYPRTLRLLLAEVVGATSYQPVPPSKISTSKNLKELDIEQACPDDITGARAQQEITGVVISASKTCIADNPYAVAAFVKGTNNIPHNVLIKSGLTPDAVEKGRDLDGDGDPDEIHIRLEVAELNGGSPELDEATTQHEIAPGIKPGFWVFTPKMFGMATENFESLKARPMLRLPSPAIRVEQGDTVKITLENSHYMPHTIHFHGVDHSFVDEKNEGNDGVPITSEKPVMPGMARTYDIKPRQAGTMFYHCHVQAQVHVMMGLQGLFIIEENRANNWVQTLNVGAGQVRASSVAVREKFDQEYDLHYMDIDKELNSRVKRSNDPRVITQSMHRDYDITDATSDYFTLNGRSFPYTIQESLVVVDPDEKIKLRIANGGSEGIALHTHGHKATMTHTDGVAVKPEAQITRDVFWIASAQRLDLTLETINDGLHSYGAGVWLFHDHQGRAITTDGISPGGHISAIVYNDYMNNNGWPKTQGVNWSQFFTEDYYQRKIPIWESYAPSGIFSDVHNDPILLIRLLIIISTLGVMLGLIMRLLLRR